MRRKTPLTAAAMLGLALLAPTTSAGAAGETCRGEAATIVGTGSTLTGTEGRDVIVTGAATEVDALGGDDLICVVPVRTNFNVLDVDAGTGNDVVDTAGASQNYYVDIDLGPGADLFEGGASDDTVLTGDADGVTTEVDTVRTGTGNDGVTTSGGSDVVDLGVGDDRLELQGLRTAADGLLAGGEGLDTFRAAVGSPGGDAFDMAAGTYRTDGALALFSSFEGLELQARSASIDYSGTNGPDYLNVRFLDSSTSTLVADLLGGDDRAQLDGTALGAGSRIDAGAGVDDLVAARSKGTLALDLEEGELEVGDDVFNAAGVEDAFLMARRVSLIGDEQDNTLVAFGCTTSIVGGRGDDELIFDPDYVFETYSYSCSRSSVMRGGAGADSFYGSPGPDRLLGGGGDDILRGDPGADRIVGGAGADRVEAGTGDDVVRGGSGADKLLGEEGRDILRGEGGRDLADGSAGRDSCVAERERKCER
ncbi:calcium-binding protein [Nocardioides glacieisoli]|uniref:Calcium-binding protein n=1 Tax=Nocardioides glacieisoli TaxID=1168730 RepID=A0A4Q2RNM5_9ACTN|nr:calcium-binding protein [Nocardioides glacieisoli]RYB90178.1 calcium-binding protein [Nocardioides glacieisoli]